MKKLMIIFAGIALFSCNESTNKNQQKDADKQQPVATVQVPVFNTDSAYAYTAKQVSFGPRIANTPAQPKCAEWLIQQLKPLADTVYVQRTTVIGPKKQPLPCINIIATFNPEAKQRILLLSHWDTRPH